MPRAHQRRVRAYLETHDRREFLRRVEVEEAELLVSEGYAVGKRGVNGRLESIQFAPDPSLAPKLCYLLRQRETMMERLDSGRRVVRHRGTPPQEGTREMYRAAVFSVVQSLLKQQPAMTERAEVITFDPLGCKQKTGAKAKAPHQVKKTDRSKWDQAA